MELFVSKSTVDNGSMTAINLKRFPNTRKQKFINEYMQDNFEEANSQDILNKYSQIPNAVITSENLKDKIRHLNKKEKSEKRMLKNINETIDLIDKSTQAGKNQVKVLVASVTDHRFGEPGLNVLWRLKGEAQKMKMNLLSESDRILTPPLKQPKQTYPVGVSNIAVKHWEDITTVEPAAHNRPNTAVRYKAFLKFFPLLTP